METVYLALGSNQGNTKQNIAKAIALLEAKISNISKAKLYTSKPAHYSDQPDFINTAVKGQTALTPLSLLKFIKDIEKKVGRIKRFQYGPREIDIDIIFYGDKIISSAKLEIPHLRFSERDFVLRPLIDLDPNVIDPRSKLSVSQLYERLPKSSLYIYK